MPDETLFLVKREDPECKCHPLLLASGQWRMRYEEYDDQRSGYEVVQHLRCLRCTVEVISARLVECETCGGEKEMVSVEQFVKYRPSQVPFERRGQGARYTCPDCLGTGKRLAPKDEPSA